MLLSHLSYLISLDNARILGAFLVGACTPFWGILKKIVKKLTHGNLKALKSIASMDMSIHDLLAEIRIRATAERVVIMQFGNGGKFFNGGPQQKSVCTHESKDSSVETMLSSGYQVPNSMLYPVIKSMLENSLEVRQVVSMKETYIKGDFIRLGVVSYVTLPLFHGTDNIVGYIMVHFNDARLELDAFAFEAITKVRNKLEASLMAQALYTE